MKKYFLLGLIVAIAPNICFGAGARYTQLVREKQRKMEELEKCMGSSKGLKIAGLSTIGLTAVGVAGNIAEAQKLQEYDDAIAKKNKDIETKEKAIVAENEKIKKIEAEKKAAEEAAAGHSASGTAVGNLNLLGPNKNVDIATQRGMDAMFGNNTRLNIPVPAAPTFVNGGNGDGAIATQGSGSVPLVVNNKNLSTDKSGTSASGQANGSVTKTTTNVSQETKRNLDDNNPNMLKNLVERDIATINATMAKVGAKIYVSGYSVKRLPAPLEEKMSDAYINFSSKCNDNDNGASISGVNTNQAMEDGAIYAQDYVVPSPSSKYLLGSCLCDEQGGFVEKQGVCVEKDEKKRCEGSGGSYSSGGCICNGDYVPSGVEFQCIPRSESPAYAY